MAGDNIGEAFVEVSAETSGFGEQVVSAAQDAGDQAASAFSDSFGSAFTDIPAVDVPVSADVSEAEAALAALPADAGPVDVPVTADVSEAEASITSLPSDVPPVDIPVTADTSDAEAAIGDLGSSASDTGVSLSGAGEAAQAAAGGFDAAGSAAAGAGSLSGAATGDINAFASGIGSMGGAASGAVAGLAALGGGVGFLFSEGVQATSAIERMSAVTGQFAGDVKNVNVGNLNESLGTLGKQLGETTPAMQTAATNAFQFATSAGAAGPKAAEFSNEIVALASRAVAANPALGSVGDVAATLTSKFASGRGTLGAYGIDLNKADIEALALAETGKTLASELTKGEKAIAAADLASQKYGNNLKQSVENASKNSEIQVRQLKATFLDAAGAIGAPLVSPMVETLKSLVPVGTEAARIVGQLGAVSLPLLKTGADAVVPALGAVSSVLDLIPAPVQQVAIGVGLAAFAIPRLVSAATVAGPAISDMVLGFGGLAGSAAAVALPLLAVAAAAIPLGIAISKIGGDSITFGAASDQLTATLSRQHPVLGQVTDALKDLHKASGDEIDFAKRMDDSTHGLVTSEASRSAKTKESAEIQKIFNDTLKQSPEAAQVLITALDQQGVSTDKFKTKLNEAIATQKNLGQASAEVAARVDPLAVGFDKAAAAVGGETRQAFELGNVLGGLVDSHAKATQAQSAYVKAVADGNVDAAQSAAVADATARAQERYNFVLLATGDAQAAAKAGSASMRESLQQLADSTTGPVHDRLVALLGLIDDYGAKHPSPTIDANTDPATSKINAANVLGQLFAGSNPSTTVDANNSPALAAIGDAINNGINFAGLNPTTGIFAVDSASSVIRGVGDAINGLPDRKDIFINVSSNVQAVVADVGAAIASVGGKGAAKGASWDIPGFAGGGSPDLGGLFTVGEEGPELMSVQPGHIDVLSNPQSRHVLSQGGGGGELTGAIAELREAAAAHREGAREAAGYIRDAAALLAEVSGLKPGPSRRLLERRQ